MTSFQSSELTELPVVENSQLFAQRVHSARYAPIDPANQRVPKNMPPRVPCAHKALEHDHWVHHMDRLKEQASDGPEQWTRPM